MSGTGHTATECSAGWISSAIRRRAALRHSGRVADEAAGPSLIGFCCPSPRAIRGDGDPDPEDAERGIQTGSRERAVDDRSWSAMPVRMPIASARSAVVPSVVARTEAAPRSGDGSPAQLGREPAEHVVGRRPLVAIALPSERARASLQRGEPGRPLPVMIGTSAAMSCSANSRAPRRCRPALRRAACGTRSRHRRDCASSCPSTRASRPGDHSPATRRDIGDRDRRIGQPRHPETRRLGGRQTAPVQAPVPLLATSVVRGRGGDQAYDGFSAVEQGDEGRQTGTPRTKLLVPSIGSMTQRRGPCPVSGEFLTVDGIAQPGPAGVARGSPLRGAVRRPPPGQIRLCLDMEVLGPEAGHGDALDGVREDMRQPEIVVITGHGHKVVPIGPTAGDPRRASIVNSWDETAQNSSPKATFGSRFCLGPSVSGVRPTSRGT